MKPKYEQQMAKAKQAYEAALGMDGWMNEWMDGCMGGCPHDAIMMQS